MTGHSSYVSSVALSRDRKTIISGSADKTIRIWDTETEKEVRILTGHSNKILSIALSRDGKTIISGSGDSTVKIWNT